MNDLREAMSDVQIREPLYEFDNAIAKKLFIILDCVPAIEALLQGSVLVLCYDLLISSSQVESDLSPFEPLLDTVLLS